MIKDWTAKRDRPLEPQVKQLDKNWSDMHAGDQMLISTPLELDAYIRKIPRGKFKSLKALRQELAEEAGADNTCPLTTGIFLRIVAEAAYQEATAGKKRVTPVWRVLAPTMPLISKLTFPVGWITEHQNAEGITFDLPARKRRAG